MSDELTGIFGSLDSNECTRFAPPEERGAPRDAPLGPREAFLVVHERLALLAGLAAGPAFVIAAVDASARVMASLVLQDRRALIVGRHTQCGLRIEDDTVSLRHTAALVRFEGARPFLHVRDLATGKPFLTEDGQPGAAVSADGPLYLSIGSVALWFLPCCPGPSLSGRAEDAWRALAPRTFLDTRPAPAPPQPVRPRIDDEITHVTRTDAPLLLDDDDDPALPCGKLWITSGERREWRAASTGRLDRGILLGRYGRCGVLLDTPEKTVSRVHALLLRVGAEVWILDTASTNGVTRGGTPVHADVLGDTDTLSLGHEITLDWNRLLHAEA